MKKTLLALLEAVARYINIDLLLTITGSPGSRPMKTLVRCCKDTFLNFQNLKFGACCFS